MSGFATPSSSGFPVKKGVLPDTHGNSSSSNTQTAMPPRKAESFNFNSVLLMIVMALSGWTLKTVSEQSSTIAAISVQVQNLERVVYGAK